MLMRSLHGKRRRRQAAAELQLDIMGCVELLPRECPQIEEVPGRNGGKRHGITKKRSLMKCLFSWKPILTFKEKAGVERLQRWPSSIQAESPKLPALQGPPLHQPAQRLCRSAGSEEQLLLPVSTTELGAPQLPGRLHLHWWWRPRGRKEVIRDTGLKWKEYGTDDERNPSPRMRRWSAKVQEEHTRSLKLEDHEDQDAERKATTFKGFHI